MYTELVTNYIENLPLSLSKELSRWIVLYGVTKGSCLDRLYQDGVLVEETPAGTASENITRIGELIGRSIPEDEYKLQPASLYGDLYEYVFVKIQ